MSNILNNINFESFLSEVHNIFSHFYAKDSDKILNLIKELSWINFKCYKANTSIIENRKSKKINHKLISDNELIARTQGEKRVKIKLSINKLISSMHDEKPKKPISNISDDIIYSIGEMADKLSIEFIKRQDYNETEESKDKIKNSLNWSKRVKKYLNFKLDEIRNTNFYEYLEETRTYKL